jgi:hypothetical protein
MRFYRIGLGLLIGALCCPASAVAEEGDNEFMMSLGNGLGLMGSETPIINVSSRVGMRHGQHAFFGSFNWVHGSANIEDGGDYAAAISTLGAGYRYSLKPTEQQKATPYIVSMIYTALPKTDIDDSVDEYINDTKTLGLLFGFGGEFTVAPSFSVSGEFGIQRFSMSNDHGEIDISGAITNTYTSIQANFYM